MLRRLLGTGHLRRPTQPSSRECHRLVARKALTVQEIGRVFALVSDETEQRHGRGARSHFWWAQMFKPLFHADPLAAVFLTALVACGFLEFIREAGMQNGENSRQSRPLGPDVTHNAVSFRAGRLENT